MNNKSGSEGGECEHGVTTINFCVDCYKKSRGITNKPSLALCEECGCDSVKFSHLQKLCEEQRVEIDRLTAMAIGHEATSEHLRVIKSQLATQTERVRVLEEALKQTDCAECMNDSHTPDALCAKEQALKQESLGADERKYPCDKCGVLRTKAEGGTTFTVCDKCWDSLGDGK